jgi:predicted lactoylglutathione lyase
LEQRLSLITLGVADVARAKAFYEQLGWHGQEVEETVFIQAGGLAVVLWSRAKLAEDAGIAGIADIADIGSAAWSGMTLAHNVRSRDEVGQIVIAAEAAGAIVTKPPADTFYGGYAAYFTDLDGHVWEIAYNPGFPLAADGSLTVPDLQ